MKINLKAVRALLATTTILLVIIIGFVAFNFEDISQAIDPQEVVSVNTANNKPTVAEINEPVAATGAMLFKNNCKSCHRIDKQLVGPPLRDVYSRRDPEWMREWIKNSSKMIANGDPTAVTLFNDNKKVAMTNFTSMSKDDLDALIAYLKYVGENKDSNFD